MKFREVSEYTFCNIINGTEDTLKHLALCSSTLAITLSNSKECGTYKINCSENGKRNIKVLESKSE